jgi:hypothetical protein
MGGHFLRCFISLTALTYSWKCADVCLPRQINNRKFGIPENIENMQQKATLEINEILEKQNNCEFRLHDHTRQT